MGFEGLLLTIAILGCVNAQVYKVCAPSTEMITCSNLEKGGSQASCQSTPTRVECAVQLNNGAAQIGYFSEEEVLLLAQRQPNNHRVIAAVKDVSRLEPYAFEAVAVVRNDFGEGIAGLRGAKYCHPGLGASDMRWSPRVLRALESLVSRVEPCPAEHAGKTAEELEVEVLSKFFSAGCRPGPWASNDTVDADFKRRYSNLCSMCTAAGTCQGYVPSTGGSTNSHMQALDCLVSNGTVAVAAWTHVRQYFQNLGAQTNNYSLLCEDGARAPLSDELLRSNTAPCSLVRQPWGAIVATEAVADALATNLRSWFPNGANPGSNTWQSSLFTLLTPGPSSLVEVLYSPVTPQNYTSVRVVPEIAASASCLPARRWCTTSAQEQDKCNWVRWSAHSLGLQPAIACQQRASVVECLADVRDDKSDFFSVDTHYGYIARQHFRLSPVKLVQNTQRSSSRVAALVKESSTANISRFENLRDKVACFPEFGGIAYVAFLRAAHTNSVISASECDYAKAVGELFSKSCAPGALDVTHTISNSSSYDATNLCSACRPRSNSDNFTCAWDNSNLYYGNNGSLLCLSDPATDVAFVETQNIIAQFTALNLQASDYRALCVNNTLATYTGVNLPDDCLLAHVVDAEVLTRRNAPIVRSLESLLDSLETYFGYNTAASEQLINLHLYSPFDGVSDLLFKDSTIGLAEPTTDTAHQPAKNYIELFRHLESCNSVPPVFAGSSRTIFSFISLAVTVFLTRFVVY